MNKVEDYADDSDQSDEDFNPENVSGGLDVSEDEADSVDEDEDNLNSSGSGDEREKKVKKASNKNNTFTNVVMTKIRRSTRRMEDSQSALQTGSSIEKTELDSDEEDKSRSDALWADFLGDVKCDVNTKAQKQMSKLKEKTIKPQINSKNERQVEKEESKESPSPSLGSSKKITLTEVLDLGGEEVVVQNTANFDVIKESKSQKSFANLKRPAADVRSKPGCAGGLGSILNQIGKKKKLSVLEKSQLDWSTFKQDEGIEEELQTHNKGKDGYLERQDFLQRTDIRQFEIEKSLRQASRQH